jgi:bifunctional DNA-binding transcriptional regulator/antitoxin component of YhaV-PrlF toxin-antitoxin module
VAKVTSKLQLTLPKAIADQYKIRPGDHLDWLPAGEAIRVVKRDTMETVEPPTLEDRLRLFDQATDRQRKREGATHRRKATAGTHERGWTREELYRRGLSG